MINFIEPAKSSNSHCRRCNKSIPVGEKRGVETISKWGHPTNSYYCAECCKKEIKLLIEHLTKLEI